jgi:hypothetical protein
LESDNHDGTQIRYIHLKLEKLIVLDVNDAALERIMAQRPRRLHKLTLLTGWKKQSLTCLEWFFGWLVDNPLSMLQAVDLAAHLLLLCAVRRAQVLTSGPCE